MEGVRRAGQACVAVRAKYVTDDNNPFDFENVRARIEYGLREFERRLVVVSLRNITNVF